METEIKNGRRIAYVRVSTAEQNEARQLDALREHNIDVYFTEKISGSTKNRPELQKMLECVQEGDTVYVAELSRLARNMIDMCEIADILKEKGATLRSLKENIDLSSPQGILTMQIFEAVAQFERAIIRERQAEGIAAAKARGKTWGRGKEFGNNPVETHEIMQAYYYKQIDRKTAQELFGSSVRIFYKNYNKWLEEHGYKNADD